MITNLPSLADAQKAIKGGKDPKAFLHLGILYAQGIGTEKNDILAHYFLKKACDMGYKEAEEYIELGYESGVRDFGEEINTILGDSGDLPPLTLAKLKLRVEKERIAGNIGNLAKIRQHLLLFYPEYNHKKAIADILDNRDSLDADILFTLSTSDNRSEVYIEQQDHLLRQLYIQVENDDDIWEYINTDVLSKDESELAQCIVNLTASYEKICQKYGIEEKEIYTLDSMSLYPYIKVSDLVLLRKQGFRALLSIRDIDSDIHKKFMECLDSDEKLLNVCEGIKDQDLQLFLISFVELNIDIESLEIDSRNLLKAYWNNNLMPLVEHINAFIDRLNKSGIKHHLPVYTLGNIPPIDFSKST